MWLQTGEAEETVSYSLFQVRPHFHNEVEGLESFLQLVAVYVGPFAIAQLAVRFKLYVVYDETMSTRAGIHFIALTHTCEGKKTKDQEQVLSLCWSKQVVINEWCLPEYYPVEFCLVALLMCSPFQGL